MIAAGLSMPGSWHTCNPAPMASHSPEMPCYWHTIHHLRSNPTSRPGDCPFLGEVLLFPATDPQALFTLGTYLADGGSVQDAQGRPALDEATLTKTLEFDQRASQSGVMPYWLTQYSNDNQVWEAFMSNEYPMAVTWASTYLKHQLSGPDDLAVASIPTPRWNPLHPGIRMELGFSRPGP